MLRRNCVKCVCHRGDYVEKKLCKGTDSISRKVNVPCFNGLCRSIPLMENPITAAAQSKA
jgi:hypothetical protein